MIAKVHYNFRKSPFVKQFRCIFEAMIFRDRAIIRLESVDSTNNYAANLLKLTSPPDGTVITAQEQTQGKGQRGAEWKATYGQNLLSSIIVYPNFIPSERTFLLSQVTALAVREVVEHFTQRDTYIKWPNDIICQNKKIAGILIEFNWMDGCAQSAIIGVGINVNQHFFDYPSAASLLNLTGKHISIEEILSSYIDQLDLRYRQLFNKQYDVIHSAYNSQLWKKGVLSDFVYSQEKIQAEIIEAQEDGKLNLSSPSKGTIICDLKEISMIF